ncbi:heavy metal translocating P-type ATPase [Cyanobium sp. Morenito 9A2]|nr:heavy metal translocating P-type ATPase [Cyanobium sp. Morenito 9A2]MCP9849893.1 heavy metal translocating P-type ATPase [Cyanobium sp. Morenito 9A2]
MKCGGCVRAVEQRLLDQPGVAQVSVNLLTRTAWVGLDPSTPAAGEEGGGEADLAAPLITSLGALGYSAQLRGPGHGPPSLRERRQNQHWWQQWRQLVVALALLLVSVAGHLAESGQLAVPLLAEIPFHALVATGALAGPGRSILVAGARGALAGVPSMDTLVGLGMGSAYLASLGAFLWPSLGWQCFFNEPVMLLGFVLLGRFLEERARFRTGLALEQLAALQPDTALLLLDGGEPRVVRVGGLRPGDQLRILPGDRLPVDGLVRVGHSAVDVSSLTGEPLPLMAAPGTSLAAGSLNLEAPLEIEVQHSGADTALARIIRLVEQAQARKAPIQGLADRVAGRFSVFVLLLAAATFVFWWLWGTALWPQVLLAAPAFQAHGFHGASGLQGGHAVLGAMATTPSALALQLAIAVLVVACPCALGLATPTAITVGAGLAARAGVLFRGGDVIEMAARVQVVLFDKTGTLTLGRPLVTAVEPVPGVQADRLLQIAASLEAQTRHPLAHALLQEAQARRLSLLKVTASETLAGQGVLGTLEGLAGKARVGRLGWLLEAGLRLDPVLEQRREQLECLGSTVLAVAEGPRLLGLVAVEDQLRPDAAAALAELQGLGLELGVLSGDREQPVRLLADRLGLMAGTLAWELLPEQKVERIIAAKGHGPVAMVGDGINDTPALAAADLGIAVGTGTQIAQDTADLVILGERLEGVALALRLARSTMVKVRQNLVWAFGYNLIVLPIAAGVLLPAYGLLLSPPLAALLMATSSITVVVNALLLRPRLA